MATATVTLPIARGRFVYFVKMMRGSTRRSVQYIHQFINSLLQMYSLHLNSPQPYRHHACSRRRSIIPTQPHPNHGPLESPLQITQQHPSNTYTLRTRLGAPSSSLGDPVQGSRHQRDGRPSVRGYHKGFIEGSCRIEVFRVGDGWCDACVAASRYTRHILYVPHSSLFTADWLAQHPSLIHNQTMKACRLISQYVRP